MESHSAIVSRLIDQAINRGKIESANDFYHDDVVEQAPFPGQGPGVEGIKDVIRGMRTAFPDMHWSIDEQVSEGDKVVTRFEWIGTHHGEFLGVPATGRPVKVWGVVIDRLEGGKIKETRLIMDTLGMMVQLGVMPGTVAA